MKIIFFWKLKVLRSGISFISFLLLFMNFVQTLSVNMFCSAVLMVSRQFLLTDMIFNYCRRWNWRASRQMPTSVAIWFWYQLATSKWTWKVLFLEWMLSTILSQLASSFQSLLTWTSKWMVMGIVKTFLWTQSGSLSFFEIVADISKVMVAVLYFLFILSIRLS